MTVLFINRRVAITGLVFFCFAFGFLLMRRLQIHQSVYDICDLIEEKFYLNNDALTTWAGNCRQSTRQLSVFSTPAEITRLLQDQMDNLKVSHFMVFSPVEDVKLWKGEALETGLKTRWMEDHLIVFQILEGSPAERAGFRLGDEILTHDGLRLEDQETASHSGGLYGVLREGKTLKFKVEAGAVQLDSGPRLKPLDPHTGLVTLSSFRSEYFEDRAWKKFVEAWRPFSRLIIDLRENSGGNVVAMLRALSPLSCRPKEIGRLSMPRREEADMGLLANDLSDDEQIQQVEAASEVLLKTFEGYGCYAGSVALLIGPHTSSVSEIFAQALLDRPKAKVFGQPSSGDVLMAVWYDLPALGRGYSISIPEALYLTPQGRQIEGEGVFPQKEIFDDLSVWRQGQDSWIQEVLKWKSE